MPVVTAPDVGVVTVGAVGTVASITTGSVPVPTLPAGSVTITVGFDQVRVPVQVTIHPIDGLGLHISQGIVVLSPDAIFVQTATTAPEEGFGVAVHIGLTGEVVSTTIGLITVPVVEHVPSVLQDVTVIVPVFVFQVVFTGIVYIPDTHIHVVGLGFTFEPDITIIVPV